jgi:glutaredoxin-related protein
MRFEMINELKETKGLTKKEIIEEEKIKTEKERFSAWETLKILLAKKSRQSERK